MADVQYLRPQESRRILIDYLRQGGEEGRSFEEIWKFDTEYGRIHGRRLDYGPGVDFAEVIDAERGIGAAKVDIEKRRVFWTGS